MDATTFRMLAGKVRSQESPLVVDIIFRAVGGSVGFIDAQGFVAACTLLDAQAVSVHYPDRTTFMSDIRRRTEQLLTNTIFSAGTDIFILVIAVLELLVDSASSGSPKQQDAEFGISVFIFIVFLLELIAKLFAFGPKRYWQEWLNRIDVLVILMTTGSFMMSQSFADATRLRIMLFLRLARLLRLMHRVRAVRSIILTVLEISPLFWRIIAVLFVTMYCLAIVGVEAFSGKLNPSDPLVRQSAYGINNQYALNYDTFTRSMMSQFAVLITTQSPVILEGLMAGTRSWWPSLYFAGVYVLIVCVVSNILIALLLQSFGISSAHTNYRQDGFVEIWEHLLSRAQLDLWLLEPTRFVHPIMFTFQRRHAFMTVNETLFGESLSLDFEIDAHEMDLQRDMSLRQQETENQPENHASIWQSLTSAFFWQSSRGFNIHQCKRDEPTPRFCIIAGAFTVQPSFVCR
jgi:hypothetical protein